jgi:hypothetical protein
MKPAPERFSFSGVPYGKSHAEVSMSLSDLIALLIAALRHPPIWLIGRAFLKNA